MVVGEKRWKPYLLLLPTFLLVLLLAYPALSNFYFSLWEWRVLFPEQRTFVGLGNFARLLTAERFITSLKFTLLFTFASLSIAFCLGLSGALLLQSMGRRRRWLTAMLILPYMIAPIAVGLGWRLIWARNYGLMNYLLDALAGIAPVSWLAQPGTAIFVVILSEAWRSFPFHLLILLAALLSIPGEVREAVRVDGASWWQEFVFVTLPLLSPAISIVLIFETVFTLRVFELVISLTGGGPGVATTPLGLLLHEYSFRFLDGGLASTLAVVLVLLGAIIALIYYKLFYREVYY